MLLILAVCITRNFHQTFYINGAIEFGIPWADFFGTISSGGFPLGICSILSSSFSLLGTRLVGKQDNLGNKIGVLTAFTAGSIDYMFGNASALITYPLTFFIMTFAVSKWKGGQRIKERDWIYFAIIFGGIALGFCLVYLGAWLFGGRTDAAFLNIIAITFGLSIGGNLCNAMKYKETWLSWVVYNLVQLTKSIIQLNLANVAKYVFYLINAGITLIDWFRNGDVNNEYVSQTN